MSRPSPSALVLALAVMSACGGDPPKAPPILRPIDEPHAVQIMVRVFKEFGIDAERGRVMHVGDGAKELKLDIAAKGKQYGIAYITWQDAEKLGEDLPSRRDPEMFMVMRGSGPGEDDARAVLFFAGDYMQDDLSGEAHTATTIAAEKKLETAARRVCEQAEHEKWP